MIAQGDSLIVISLRACLSLSELEPEYKGDVNEPTIF